MEDKNFVAIDIYNKEHCAALLTLLNDYMEDEMGVNKSMPAELGAKIIKGLREHRAYLGFLVKLDGHFVALANCNLNYSTWQAKFLINIHDFIVAPQFRKQGIAQFLLYEIEAYAKERGYCNLSLELRSDNFSAQRLYKKVGYKESEPSMFFWNKKL